MELKTLKGMEVKYEFDGEVRYVGLFHDPDTDHFTVGFTRPLKTASAENNLLDAVVIRISDDKEYLQTSIFLSKSAAKALLTLLIKSPEMHSPDIPANQRPDEPR